MIYKTVLLTLGMALLGYRIFPGMFIDLVGRYVMTNLHPSAWIPTMMAFAQGGAALATFLLGVLVLGLPWYAALIAAMFVGVTTHTRPADPAFDEALRGWEGESDCR